MKPLTIPSRKIDDDENTHAHHDSTPMPTDTSETKKQNTNNESFIGEVFKFAFLALIIVIPFRIYIAQPFIVSGSSMFPTFHNGEYIIVDQITYRMEKPKRGDVVIFRYPNDPSKFFIKRIIGLPGEIVQLANGITTIINPKTKEKTILDEQYLITDKTDDHLSITLSSTEYFVMGDNRSASSDSRVWGPVPEKNLVGRALIRLLPLNTIGTFPGEYNYQHIN